MTWTEIKAQAARPIPNYGAADSNTDARDKDIAKWAAGRMLELVISGYSADEAYGIAVEEITNG